MKRALVDALKGRDCYEPVLVLSPGQKAPDDWTGEIIRLDMPSNPATIAPLDGPRLATGGPSKPRG